MRCSRAFAPSSSLALSTILRGALQVAVSCILNVIFEPRSCRCRLQVLLADAEFRAAAGSDQIAAARVLADSNGGLAGLVTLLAAPSPNTVMQAAWALARLGEESNAATHEIVSAGALLPLAAAVERAAQQDEPGMHRCATYALVTVAEAGAMDAPQQASAPAVLRALLAALRHDTPDCVVRAMEALRTLASRYIAKPAVGQYQYAPPTMPPDAALPGLLDRLLAAGAPAALAATLSHPAPPAIAYAADVLGVLAGANEAAAMAVAAPAGALAALVRLASAPARADSPMPGAAIARSALFAIRLLSLWPALVPRLANAGAIPALAAHLQPGGGVAMSCAADSLSKLVFLSSARYRQATAAGCMQKLTTVLQHGATEEAVSSANAFCALAGAPAAVRDELVAVALPALVSCMAASSPAQLAVRAAAVMLHLVTSTAEHRGCGVADASVYIEAVVRAGALPLLASLPARGDVVDAATRCYAQSEDPATLALRMIAGLFGRGRDASTGPGHVVSWQRGPRHVCALLARLFINLKQKAWLLLAETIDAVLEALQDSGLQSMASLVVDAGALPTLVSFLDSGKGGEAAAAPVAVAESAARALAHLAAAEDGVYAALVEAAGIGAHAAGLRRLSATAGPAVQAAELLLSMLTGSSSSGGGVSGAAAPEAGRGHCCAACATPSSQPGVTLKLCTGCRGVRYCGAECQKAHWRAHKAACRAARAALAALQGSQQVQA